jgi:hypothetical protein
MNPLTDNPLAIAADVGDVLDSVGVRYAIVGSLASSAVGLVRTTADADLLAEMEARHVAPLVQLLGTAFVVDEAMMRDAVSRRGSFNLIHEQALFKVDVFVSAGGPFERSQLARRRRVQVMIDPPREAYLASAEDVVLGKLAWYRQGHEASDTQWRDVLGILLTQAGHLDWRYLAKWADALGIGDLLDRARREAERVDEAPS